MRRAPCQIYDERSDNIIDRMQRVFGTANTCPAIRSPTMQC